MFLDLYEAHKAAEQIRQEKIPQLRHDRRIVSINFIYLQL